MYKQVWVSVETLPKLKLEVKISNFIDEQISYCFEEKKHIINNFKSDLSYRIHHEGLTDENLLLGLTLNNYERQLHKPTDNRIKIEEVTYNIG